MKKVILKAQNMEFFEEDGWIFWARTSPRGRESSGFNEPEDVLLLEILKELKKKK